MTTSVQPTLFEHLDPDAGLRAMDLERFARSGLLVEVYSSILGYRVYFKAQNRKMSKSRWKRTSTEYRGHPIISSTIMKRIAREDPPLSVKELRLLVKFSPFGINPRAAFVRIPEKE